MPKLTIAIDGPAGSGKSSVARIVAGILGYLYLDSGAMYRALALKALQRKVPLDDETQLAILANETHIELRSPSPEQEKAGIKNRVFLDGKEVTQEIRAPEVAQAASRLATIAAVRAVLVAEQQRAGAGGGIVMEGRDIGTVVFPSAELKIFLEASPEVRAERRWKEHQEKGEPMTLAQVLEKLRACRHADWRGGLQDSPEIPAYGGYPGQSDRWPAHSPAGIERHKKHLANSLATLKAFRRNDLPPSEQLNFDLCLELLETASEGLQFGDEPYPFRAVTPFNLWMPLDHMGGIQQYSPATLALHPHHTVAAYELILKRLVALPVAVDQQIALLQDGLKRGYTPPKIVLRDLPKQIADVTPADPLASALLQAFTEFPPNFPDRKSVV